MDINKVLREISAEGAELRQKAAAYENITKANLEKFVQEFSDKIGMDVTPVFASGVDWDNNEKKMVVDVMFDAINLDYEEVLMMDNVMINPSWIHCSVRHCSHGFSGMIMFKANLPADIIQLMVDLGQIQTHKTKSTTYETVACGI